MMNLLRKYLKRGFTTTTPSRNSEKGQSIVLIAVVFIGLLAFIGLTVDMGILFISYGNLRRAVDSASLAAASQYREGYDNDKLTKSAIQFLQLNNVNDALATVQTCDYTHPDPALCLSQKRKLIRVTASAPVNFVFLPAIGFNGTTISAHAISEAASMDVVLVIDTSESMANDPPVDHPEYKDSAVCNAADNPSTSGDGIPGECHPFEEVKDAAADSFASWVLDRPESEESDRLAIVTFNNGWQNVWSADGKIPEKGTGIVCPGGLSGSACPGGNWISDKATAVDLIHNLKVYETANCNADYQTNGGPGICTDWLTGSFAGIRTPWRELSNIYTYHDPTYDFTDLNAAVNTPDINGDRSTAQTTNIGGGLKLAASMFGQDMRSDAVWLVVLLTDGAANATNVDPAQAGRVQAYYEMPASYDSAKYWPANDLPVGFCPGATRFSEWDAPCRDKDVTTRHISTSPNYDAEDYARDNADLVSCDVKSPKAGCSQPGQGAVMFSIGLGNAVFDAGTEIHGTPYGDTLLRYVAAVGDDGDPGTDPCNGVARDALGYTCGNYYYIKDATGLTDVFDQIASKIYTRITQ
jgi:Flp pilus assembly protein TadG